VRHCWYWASQFLMQTIRLGYGIALFSCYLHNILQVTTLDHIRSTLQLLRLILSGQCWLGILIHSPCLAVLVGVLCVLVGGQTVPCLVLWGSATPGGILGLVGTRWRARVCSELCPHLCVRRTCRRRAWAPLGECQCLHGHQRSEDQCACCTLKRDAASFLTELCSSAARFTASPA